MPNLSPMLRQRFFDANGAPLAGGKLFSYAANSSTPLATYDETGATNANPVILDADGYADVWLGDATYKFRLEDANGVEQWTIDNVASPFVNPSGGFTGPIGGTTPYAGAFTSVSASTGSITTLAVKNLNGILCADQYSGADWAAKLNAAMGAGGVTVFVPDTLAGAATTALVIPSNTTVIFDTGTFTTNSTITADGASNIHIRGSANLGTVVQFTGTQAALISLKSTLAIVVEEIVFQYTDAGFAGLVIDTSHSGGGGDSSTLVFQNMKLGGTPTSTGAVALLSLDKTNSSVIDNVSFSYAGSAIRGLAAGGSYANQIAIRNSKFGFSGVSNFPNGDILNPGGNWTIADNTFEQGTGTQSIINCAVAAPAGLNFTGNWSGDPGVFTGGVTLKNMPSGTNVSGNFITGSNASTGTFMTFAATAIGINVVGNYIQNYAVGFDFSAGGIRSFTLLGNALPTITALTSGTLPIADNSGFMQCAGTEVAGSATGAQWVKGWTEEEITLSTSGATTDSVANLLPANSIIEAVTARVTVTITTATDWKLGDGTTAGRFTAAIATLTAGTTTVGLVHCDQTGAGGPKQTAAAKLRITTTGTPGAGKIRVSVAYRTFIPPTS